MSAAPPLRSDEESPKRENRRHPRANEYSVELVIGGRVVRKEQRDTQHKARGRTEKNRQAKDEYWLHEVSFTQFRPDVVELAISLSIFAPPRLDSRQEARFGTNLTLSSLTT